MSVKPLRAKVPKLKVGADTGPEKSTGPLKVAPPPLAPPAERKVTGPLTVLPSKVTVIGFNVKETPVTNDAGTGDALIEATSGPVICGLVKVKVSMVAACAAPAPSRDTVKTEASLTERSMSLLLVIGDLSVRGRNDLHSCFRGRSVFDSMEETLMRRTAVLWRAAQAKMTVLLA
jgi:hypothetical protein